MNIADLTRSLVWRSSARYSGSASNECITYSSEKSEKRRGGTMALLDKELKQKGYPKPLLRTPYEYKRNPKLGWFRKKGAGYNHEAISK